MTKLNRQEQTKTHTGRLFLEHARPVRAVSAVRAVRALLTWQASHCSRPRLAVRRVPRDSDREARDHPEHGEADGDVRPSAAHFRG